MSDGQDPRHAPYFARARRKAAAPPASKLLPCPHCGGEAMLDETGSGNTDALGNNLARVWCPDPECKTHGTAYLPAWEAVKAWNRRAPVRITATPAMARAAANAHANSDKDKLEDWVRFVQAALDAAT